jgi:2-hydroxy-6-oxonona-2,4-dienedioate hydrolase
VTAGSRSRQTLGPRESCARAERTTPGGPGKESEAMSRILNWSGVASTAVVALFAAAYLRDMARAYGRVRGRSTVVPSSCGDIEYTEGGSGPPVLVIHGSGGGYDQGELLVRALLGDRFHWITPSRFGYLRSTFRDGATFDDQAHAYARLLDHLGVDEVAVVALSHGGPSALLFAALHPERVSSLTLISCGVASSDTRDQAQADRRGDVLMTVFKHDALYWSLTKLFRQRLKELMGADGAVIAGLTRGQRALVDQVVDHMNPVAPRAAGAAFDNAAALPNGRIAAVRAPTLIFHARDDTLQLFHNAEFAASAIPDAKLVSFERGGHLLLSVEQATIRRAMQRHILDHAGKQSPQGSRSARFPTADMSCSVPAAL